MTRPALIGLAGYAGAGKDTVREILASQHEYDGIAFADPMRDMLGALFDTCGIKREWMTARHLKEQDIPIIGASYRKMAQELGTGWGRSLDTNFWLKIASARIALHREYGSSGVVISDVRFLNEAAWIRAQGGRVWMIVRPGIDPVREHESEKQIASIPYDYVIYNGGSIDDLSKAVEAALSYGYEGASA